MNVRIQRERDAQFERERAVVALRQAVVSAVAPTYMRRLGSSAVFEAVDEALAQIVAAGEHLGEPDQVKALWVTCARRRLIDQQRSAEVRHRDAAGADTVNALADNLCGDLSQLTEEGRQRWRIREILSVLRGDQRRWAEAWFDEILSGSRLSGAQPRGLAETLGWSPSKTKSVSRRARLKMAAFIDNRVSGAVCDEQRAWLDAFILTGVRGGGEELDGEHYAAVLFHVAGCDDCWAAWRARRRTLLGRCRSSILVPIDALAIAAHGVGDKLIGLALGAHGQATSLLARVGIGGAAAAGGGAATIGGKATAVCVGIVCVATASTELAGVLPPVPHKPHEEARASVAHPKKTAAPAAPTPAALPSRAGAKVNAPAAPAAPVKAAVPVKAAAQKALRAFPAPASRGFGNNDPSPGDRSSSTPPPPPPPAAAASPTFSTSSEPAPATSPPPAAAPASSFSSTCVPGDFGC